MHISLQPMRQQASLRNGDRDWTGVTSAKERRRLQNRLNQRALYERRKMRGTKTLATKQAQPRFNAADVFPGDTEGTRLLTRICFLNHEASHQQTINLARQALHEYLSKSYDLGRLASLVRLNVFFAWQDNARMLGFSDIWLSEDIVSPFCAEVVLPREADSAKHGGEVHGQYDTLPVALRPTPTQKKFPHHPWVDVIPHPQLRDNIIVALAQGRNGSEVDEFELCHDLIEVVGPTVEHSPAGFKRSCELPPLSNAARGSDLAQKAWDYISLVHESAEMSSRPPSLLVWESSRPCETKSWEVSAQFVHKWGWLLSGCDALLQATNVWRRARGEQAIKW
ncbi:uncharacterized protein B0I36DRAFT_326394 [Microdochium trichocladiopsis]|uniref:BZIP domain-containing protein n=1 Tax=Microdochium trichocladiopsis TaxID=1682393 RepID=A0A9P8Y7I3_9PEZI|nr:uncharacterized protein B0I36DRAFT_326394 [Microdochium trichocladiopsis]KAH7029818.1 hypothetical protein B0I36DRAFT_326394 [Microdochium trichocladiopsis]